MNGPAAILPGRAYQLIDGRTLTAEHDAAGDIALRAPDGGPEYVTRDSRTCGRPCIALVERR